MKMLQGRVVGGSGSGKFLKGDGSDNGGFAYYQKSTTNMNQTWARAVKKLWDEAVKGIRGAAGHGDGAKVALIFEIEGELYVQMRLEDHVEAMTSSFAPYIQPDKAQERRRRSMLPPSQR